MLDRTNLISHPQKDSKQNVESKAALKLTDLPKIKAVRAVVPEEMSRELASANAWSAFTKALLIAFCTQSGKWESSTMNLRMFFLTNDAASVPPWPSNTCPRILMKFMIYDHKQRSRRRNCPHGPMSSSLGLMTKQRRIMTKKQQKISSWFMT